MIIDFEIRWGAGRSGPVAIPPVDILPSPTLASGPPACLCALRIVTCRLFKLWALCGPACPHQN